MSTAAGERSTATGEIVLFGVRLVVDSMRKSVSLNNLSQYFHPQDPLLAESAGDRDVAAGYTSADDAGAVRHRSSSPLANAASRDRKRGVPWTEEEHKLFLIGLQKVRKDDWRGISRNLVKTRTPTQVVSHAQKYFIRRSNLNRRRRRSNLFAITTETVSAIPAEDQHASKNDSSSQSGTSKIPIVKFSVMPMHPVPATAAALPAQADQIMSEKVPVVQDYLSWSSTTTNINDHQMVLMTPLPLIPASTTDKSAVTDLDLNKNATTDSSPLSLNLSLPLPSDESNLSRQSSFYTTPCFFSGDSMISVG